MVKTAHTRQAYDLGVRRRPMLRRPTRWGISELGVDPIGVVVGNVFAEQLPQMRFIEHDHMIQQLQDIGEARADYER